MMRQANVAEPRILHFAPIANTQALPVAVDAWHALQGAGHCGRLVLIEWDDAALLAVRPDGTPMGIITYRQKPAWRAVEIWLGFVYPEFRGHGVYRSLWDELVRTATFDGAVEIVSGTHSANTTMRAVAAKLGRTESGVYLRYAVNA